jgi:hypothetical protein
MAQDTPDSAHATPSRPIPAPARRSRRRRAFLAALTLLPAWLLLEAGSLLILTVVSGEFPFPAQWEQQRGIAAPPMRLAQLDNEVLHPYLGFVLNPRRLDDVNEYGFPRSDADIPRRDPSRLIVGVTGGSVAYLLCRNAGEHLKRELRRLLPGRDIVLVSLAVPGYKQPQQVMALTYMRCLGAEFDVLLNLDGFNEAVLVPTEDERGETFHYFPRSWRSRILAQSDEEELALRLTIHRLYRERRDWASCMRSPPWRYSPLAQLVWRIRHQSLNRGLREGQTGLTRLTSASATLNYTRLGPANHFADDADRCLQIADAWAGGSRHLRRICASDGTIYVHALQPNQYDPGSKPLSDVERKIAIAPGSQYVRAVAESYPLLRSRGAELRHSGVHFVDLTRLFAETPEIVYADECCHFNELGNQMLAERLAAEVAAAAKGD